MKCKDCGLVVNKTVYEMTEDEWAELNDSHKEYQGTNDNPVDPDWICRLHAQASVICGLIRHEIVAVDGRNVDYGCGDGKLSEYINDEYEKSTGVRLSHYIVGKYDKYMCPSGATDYYRDDEVSKGAFDFVLSCSVFEHLIGIDDVDNILSLVNESGIVAMHVLVCEEVPNDSEWYYLLPSHCTIWTNRAMKMLYQKYGFVGCAYHVEARMWFFFKDEAKYQKIQSAQYDIPGTWVISEKFVDYWKQKPYRSE